MKEKHADLLNNLSVAVNLQRQGQDVAAKKLLQEARAAYPDNPWVQYYQGISCTLDQDWVTAKEQFLLALKTMSNEGVIYYCLASTLLKLGESAAAEEAYEKVFQLTPDYTPAHKAYLNFLYQDAQLEKIIAHEAQHQKMLHQSTDCLYWLMKTYTMLGKHEEALGLSDEIMRLDKHQEQRFAYGRYDLLSMLGRLEEAKEFYPARRQVIIAEKETVLHLGTPLWEGEALEEKKVAVVLDQGIGDHFINLSAFPDLMKQAGQVTLFVEPRLLSLFERSFPGANCISWITANNEAVNEAIIAADYVCFYSDLIFYLRPTLESYQETPMVYVHPEKQRLTYWQEKLSELPQGLNVGIVWQSSLQTKARCVFYPPLDDWGDLLTTAGVNFISLQYGDSEASIAKMENDFGATIHQFPELDLYNDFEGLAALCQSLDYVIGPTISTLNLAGAVGVPTLTMLPVSSTWECLGTRQFPMQPFTKIFQQATFGDWSNVMEEAQVYLEQRLHKSSP